MAPGTDATACVSKSENGLCKEHEKDSVFDKKAHEEYDDSAQAKASRPPLMRHCSSHATLTDPFTLICAAEAGVKSSGKDSGFQPTFRSGSCSEIGPKQYMEDEFICVDDLFQHLGTTTNGFQSPGAFYGVFDGHGGSDAASFTRKNILKFITEDSHFPNGVKRALKNAFVKADHALADAKNLDRSSGTTALIALVLGRTMIIANAGDSRAVLGKRGRAIELSKDHKPNCTSERLRIEKLGGVIYDGYLNGQLSVARALGDWHMKGDKGSQCPLSSEPELEELILTEEDEFLIIGCDGLWDVMSSQYAVTIVRKELMVHNDPERCSGELVREALKRNTCDNLTVVVICFSADPPPRIEVPKSHRRRSISAEGLDILKGVLSQA
ncbi:Protein phosphatase 2C family protein [Perilla frutescens var. frutescens]|nr:Protein phosphatase 2C family protein [Perilla frutescens var. frutescens]